MAISTLYIGPNSKILEDLESSQQTGSRETIGNGLGGTGVEKNAIPSQNPVEKTFKWPFLPFILVQIQKFLKIWNPRNKPDLERPSEPVKSEERRREKECIFKISPNHYKITFSTLYIGPNSKILEDLESSQQTGSRETIGTGLGGPGVEKNAIPSQNPVQKPLNGLFYPLYWSKFKNS